MFDLTPYRFDGSNRLDLSNIHPWETNGFNSKNEAKERLAANVEKMKKLQDKLYAHDRYSLLIIFQAMDTAGKDSVIKHVMSGLNPQGTQVYSFKQPSPEELDHDYLWRINKCLPERGRIGIFNRSYYEEVLVARVHNLILNQKLPQEFTGDEIWNDRYRQILSYELYLYQNGILPVKLFLHISKAEQKKRLLERIDDKTKNWKLSGCDITERQYWDEYQKYYEEAINNTATPHAPWYVIPSDKKWFSHLLVSEVVIQTLKALKLKYPEMSESHKEMLQKCKKALLEE